jgi:hypothetical protein
VDRLPALQVGRDTASGKYRLEIGFYDAEQGAERTPLYDQSGRPLPDASLVLTEIEVLPWSPNYKLI